MSKRIQLRRGTTAEANAFTGAVGEVTVDTDKGTVVVHDGTTVGGHPVATRANEDGTISLIKKDGTSAGIINSAGLFNDTLTSTNTNQALTAAQGKVLGDKIIGLSQGYVPVGANRVKDTTYTNTTGRPLYLYVQNLSSAAITELSLSITVNGVTMGFNGGGDAASGATKAVSAYLVVPIGATYTVKSDFTAWVELR